MAARASANIQSVRAFLGASGNRLSHEPSMRRGPGKAESPNLGNPYGLTPREQEIARLADYGNREIAEQLDISAETVKAHMKTIRLKTGAENRARIAVLVDRAERGAAA